MADNVTGEEDLIRKLRNLKSGVGSGMSQVVLAGAFVLEGFIKQSMQEGHHGRIYTRGGNRNRHGGGGRPHQASAPGETPAVDYGALLNSIQSSLLNGESAQVGTNAEAAPSLELGTAFMEARPFMRPVVDEHTNEVSNAMGLTAVRLIEEALR